MTNMIVVGQLGIQDNRTRCKLDFEQQDGRSCAFTFETASIINIEGQNYVLESDGRLWQLLPNGFEVKDALKALVEVQAKEDAQTPEAVQEQTAEPAQP